MELYQSHSQLQRVSERAVYLRELRRHPGHLAGEHVFRHGEGVLHRGQQHGRAVRAGGERHPVSG